MSAATKLRAVPPSTTALTREALIVLDEAERAEKKARALVAGLLRRLADERGVAFIRVEAAKREMLG